MARRLRTDPQIDRYIQYVIGEAKHHAGNVKKTIFPLSQAVRQRLNLSADEVWVYEREGNMARSCWVKLNGKTYFFTYNYGPQQIEIRHDSMRGTVYARLDDSMSQAQINAVVSGM